MSATKAPRVDTYTFLRDELWNAEHQHSELSMQLTGLTKRIARLKQLVSANQGAECPECKGHGHVNVWYDQDDCKSEVCKRCKGTGEGETPQ